MTVKFSLTDGKAYELNRVAEVVDSGDGYYLFKPYPYKGATIQVKNNKYFNYEWDLPWQLDLASIIGGITII